MEVQTSVEPALGSTDLGLRFYINVSLDNQCDVPAAVDFRQMGVVAISDLREEKQLYLRDPREEIDVGILAPHGHAEERLQYVLPPGEGFAIEAVCAFPEAAVHMETLPAMPPPPADPARCWIPGLASIESQEGDT